MATGHLWPERPFYVATDEPSHCGCLQETQLTIKAMAAESPLPAEQVLGAQRITKRFVKMSLLSASEFPPPGYMLWIYTPLACFSAARL